MNFSLLLKYHARKIIPPSLHNPPLTITTIFSPQLSDAKRSAEEHANTVEEIENARRKLSRDQEDLNAQIEDLRFD